MSDGARLSRTGIANRASLKGDTEGAERGRSRETEAEEKSKTMTRTKTIEETDGGLSAHHVVTDQFERMSRNS